MAVLDKHAQLSLAIALVAHGAKLSIVQSATTIALPTLRSLHHELHGTAPRGGPVALTAAGLLRTRQQQASAALFGCIYCGLGAGGHLCSIDWIALINAYEIYRALLAPDSEGLDINLAWALAVDFKGGQARLAHCEPCAAPYLVVAHSLFGATCPLCSLYARA